MSAKRLASVCQAADEGFLLQLFETIQRQSHIGILADVGLVVMGVSKVEFCQGGITVNGTKRRVAVGVERVKRQLAPAVVGAASGHQSNLAGLQFLAQRCAGRCF